MKSKVNVIKITLCGPSDVAKEFDIARDVLTEWNIQHSDALNCYVKHQQWVTDSVPDLSDFPQAVINKQLINDSDIIVAIFWSRFGTPTQTAGSGTEEEIQRGVTLGKRVMVYFSELDPLPEGTDARQLSRLSSFRTFLLKKGLCFSFSSRNEFRTLLQRHVSKVVHDLLASLSNETDMGSSQVIVGDNNIQANGSIRIESPRNTIKPIITRRPGSVSNTEQRQISKMIDALVDRTIGKTRSEAYAEWWQRFKIYMDVTKYEEVMSDDMPKAKAWFKMQKALQTDGYKAKDPQQWRNDHIRAIKAYMTQNGYSNETFYPIVAQKLKLKKVFASLKDLTKRDLERVYNLTRRIP